MTLRTKPGPPRLESARQFVPIRNIEYNQLFLYLIIYLVILRKKENCFILKHLGRHLKRI
jgi:hypothetical protein